jgi:hypothetical protein
MVSHRCQSFITRVRLLMLWVNIMSKSQANDDDRLLHCHRLHAGVYARVANKLKISAGYVSLVAAGKRQSEKVKRAIVSELKRIERLRNGL